MFRKTLAALLIGAAAVAASQADAQSYPQRPITVVTSGAGGSSDISARAIAAGITGGLGQPVVIKNASGQVAIETVANAQPDGYTLLYYGNVIWISPLLQKDASWDAFKNFAPIIAVAKAANVLAVHPSLPVKTVADLIKLAKEKPGQLQFAAAGVGSSTYMAGELFNFMAGVDIERVQYKDTGTALLDVLAGRVPVIFGSPLGIAEHLKSGALRAIAVTSEQPTPLAPGLPTVAETLPGYKSVSVEALMAPAGTPPNVVERLRTEVAKYLALPATREHYARSGADIAAGGSEELAAEMRSQVDAVKKAMAAGAFKVQ